MQEEVTQKTIALYVKVGKGAARLTEQALQKAIQKFLEQKSKPAHGKQTMRQLLKHWVFITGWSTFLRMVTLLLIFLIMNIVILLEKRQQDRSSVIYKNIPRKQSPVPVCQPYPELLQKLEMDTLWLMILFYAGNQKQERNIRYIQMI